MSPDRLSVCAHEAATCPKPNGTAAHAAVPEPARGAAPSPNGSNGDRQAPEPSRAAGCTHRGPEEPGNPFARRVAALRRTVVTAVTPDDLSAIMAKMIERARAGNVGAARLVLAYAVGRPAPAPNPDRLDIEEWQGFREAAPMVSEAETLLTPDASLMVGAARASRYAQTRTCADLLGRMLDVPLPQVPGVLKQFRREQKRMHKG
jgi:hypothetical protein